MKIFLVAWKSFLELWREPFVLILSALLPLVFLLVYIAAYSMPELKTLRVAAVDRHPQGPALIGQLEAVRYPDGRPVFSFLPLADSSAADALLRDKKADALLWIDPGGVADTYAVTLRGDALSTAFIQAGTLLDSETAAVNDRMAGRTPAVSVREQPLQTMSVSARPGYLIYLPGLIVFAVLTLVPSTAILLGREMRTRTLERLRLSGLSTLEYLGGVGLSQLTVGIVQALLVVIVITITGVSPLGAWPVLAAGILCVAASSVAAGLMLGAFIRNDSQAVNLGYTVTMVQVFLCGAFFPVPTPALFTIAGHEIGWFDGLPATHGLMAMQQALLYGSGWNQVGFRLAAAAFLTVIWFIVGLLLFRSTGMGSHE
jgi:ABC-2 type transport system permease protein